MVVYAMVAARRSAGVTPARIRIPSYAVWEVTVFVLNVLAFILVGLQLKPIISRLDRSQWLQYVWVAASVCAAAIVARLVWVMGVAALSSWHCRGRTQRGPVNTVALSPRAAALVGWCGMRGIVTLAAALALPDGSSPFPYRDLILFTAFAVVLGTLVLQGITLRPLMAWLRLDDDGAVEREIQVARVEALSAALTITGESGRTDTIEFVRRRYDLELRRANVELNARDDTQFRNSTDNSALSKDEADLIRAAIAAERQRLIALRANGTIGDAAFQRVEQELDWRELDLEQFLLSGLEG